ncbi:MAG: tRNA (N(6)-L-threonylcarbamoyladenosine(37)-C(2))-methylthiotransferase, partial [Nanoarchaeota archaeon]
TESFFKKKLKELSKKGKKVVVAGCISQSDSDVKELEDFSLIGTYQIHNITPVVEETLNGNTVRLVAEENESRLNLPKIRQNELIEIVPISHGCDGHCTFCKTKQARGELYSYPIKDIVKHVKNAVNEGVREIWLTSQDNGAYGLDIDTDFTELLKQILRIPGDYKIRVGMANPWHMLDILDEMIWLFKEHKKLFRFLHIPVQAGNNRVLKLMGRKHSAQDFKYITKRLRDSIDGFTIATDIICGFPTETDEEFDDTMDLIKGTRPDIVNISKFWLRPGTAAQNLEQTPGAKIKARSQKLTRMFRDYMFEENKRHIGTTTAFLVTEKGKDNTYIGRNDSYRQIVVASDENIMGEDIKAKIIDCTSFYLIGKRID